MSIMTRGQAQDLVSRLASENPAFREALIRDPRTVLERQFGIAFPKSLTVKAVVEPGDTLHVIVSDVVEEGELRDFELEGVAGGWKVVDSRSARAVQAANLAHDAERVQ